LPKSEGGFEMNGKHFFGIGFIGLLLFMAACSDKLIYNSVKDNTQCSVRGGYWYNNKCWKNYEDEGISNSDIDSTVASQMEIINKSTIEIDNIAYPLHAFLPLQEDDGMTFITVFGIKDNYKTLVFQTGKKNIKKGTFETPALLFEGDAISRTLNRKSVLKGTAIVKVVNREQLEFYIKGAVSDTMNNSSIAFSFSTNEAITGAGNSSLELKGNEAYLSGGLGTVTYAQVKDLIRNHPAIKTIVMTQIAGSLNDAVNMHTGRLLRENGFTTKVLSNSDIASGGVDLFCAGVKRIVEEGAKIGVHSWCCVDGLTAIEIPKDHPAHQYQIAYFTMTLGPENGPAFYFYTLEASPFDSVHYMTDKEIKKWNIATEFIEDK